MTATSQLVGAFGFLTSAPDTSTPWTGSLAIAHTAIRPATTQNFASATTCGHTTAFEHGSSSKRSLHQEPRLQDYKTIPLYQIGPRLD